MTGADREAGVIDAFVSLSNSLAGSFDVVELLSDLTTHCASLLDVESAGLLLADARHVLHVMAASSERTRDLELFQLQREEGPCLECYRDGTPVLVEDLSEYTERWPQFVNAATQAGFASVHALPLRLHDTVLGTLGLFGAHPGALNEEDLRLGQALADVASISIVHGDRAADRDLLVEQLSAALQSRVIIEQAKGIVAQQYGLEMDGAFQLLRAYARNHNRKLGEVARNLVSRDLSVSQLSRDSTSQRRS
jgi:transcriptional regulator with GAF, ATPase, and Fis domain